VVRAVEQDHAGEFREFMLDNYLLERDLATPVIVHGLLNVNSPSDYLRAVRHVLGDGSYVSPDSECAATSSLTTVAVEENCRIGKIVAEDVIIFPGVTIGDDCELQECIIGRGTYIAPGISIQGSRESPIVIGNFKTIERRLSC